MTKMIQTLRTSVFLIFIFEFIFQNVVGIPPPSRNFRCNCIRAKDCEPYTLELLNRRMEELSGVIEKFRDTGCGSTLLSEPMVCCPIKMEAFDFTHQHSKSMKERWIWDRRAQTSDEKTKSVAIENKFLNDQNLFNSMNLINDYVDWKTHRNCPPILFKEPQRGLHKSVRMHHLPYDNHHVHRNQHPLGHRPPDYFDFDDHFRPHSFHQHTRHQSHFDQEDSDSNEDGSFHSGRKNVFRPSDFPELPGRTPIPVSTFTTATTQKVMPSLPTVNSPNCGVTLNKRIVGGTEALPGEFPWITRLAYLNRSDNSVAYRCSGSFVTELHVLTAAHCVTNLDTNLNLTHIRLVDLNAESDCSNPNEPCQELPNAFEIVETVVHPNYDSPKRANDIAIIKINKQSNIELNYGTICLPAKRNFTNELIGSTGIVAGWSSNEGMAINDLRVRYLRLPIVNNSDCAERYDSFREGFEEKISIISSMICTQGQANGSDVCRGDSGGPLMDDSENGRYTLLGIVAFGPICGFTNLLPGVYMRISEYVDWIINNVR